MIHLHTVDDTSTSCGNPCAALHIKRQAAFYVSHALACPEALLAIKFICRCPKTNLQPLNKVSGPDSPSSLAFRALASSPPSGHTCPSPGRCPQCQTLPSPVGTPIDVWAALSAQHCSRQMSASTVCLLRTLAPHWQCEVPPYIWSRAVLHPRLRGHVSCGAQWGVTGGGTPF